MNLIVNLIQTGKAYIEEEVNNTLLSSIGPLPDYPQTTVDKVASVIELDFD